MKSHLKSTAHSQHLCRYHIVFIPKWRKPVLKEYQFVIARLINEKINELKCHMIELSIQPDHIHLFIEARPDANMAQLIGKLKSYLSKNLFQIYPELLEHFPKRNLWARGYFIGTCGVDAEVIKNYIRIQ